MSLTDTSAIKDEVRRFYDRIGWSQIGEGVYQNARYEDLRPVAREYIRHCHARVSRWLDPTGDLLLDAGSGPIQYPEYLAYSQGFRRRVCLDISRTALVESRQRIGDHGLFVIGDLARLPFRAAAFEGVVSLHAIHHLPAAEQQQGFFGLLRVLAPGRRAVVVYSWGRKALMTRLLDPLILASFRLQRAYARRRRGGAQSQPARDSATNSPPTRHPPAGTFTYKHDYAWAVRQLQDLPQLEILTWRSVSTSFLRAFIFPQLFGRQLLWVLSKLEDAAPRLFGRMGQHPMFCFMGTERQERQ